MVYRNGTQQRTGYFEIGKKDVFNARYFTTSSVPRIYFASPLSLRILRYPLRFSRHFRFVPRNSTRTKGGGILLCISAFVFLVMLQAAGGHALLFLSL